MYARLYDESRHVGKFPRDHRSQVLRQTKGAWLHTVIFCRIYGAPSLRLYYRTRGASKPRVHMCLHVSPDVGMRISSLTSIRLVDYRETGRALSRVKWHTRDLYVAQFYGAFRSFPRSYKVDIVNFYCTVCHTRHAVNFFQILLRILVAHCLTNVMTRDPRGWHEWIARCKFKFYCLYEKYNSLVYMHR